MARVPNGRRLAGWVAAVAGITLLLTGCGISRSVVVSDSPSAEVSTPAAPTPSPVVTTPAVVTPTPTPTPTPPPPPPTSAEPAPAPATEEAAAPETSEAPPPEPDTTKLRVGDEGPAVLALQQRLSDLGYWMGTPDGHFGYLTSQAVLAFQKVAGLGRDGIAGPVTQAALAKGIRPEARTSGDGIEIDLTHQVLLVIRDGSVVRIYNVSTGSGKAYDENGSSGVAITPTGTFSVQRAIDNPNHKSPLGILYRPRFFVGGIAVHGAASVPGYPASHGCVRISNAAMDTIWANGYMPIGGRVVVYR